MKTKVCTKCGKEKNVCEFHKMEESKDGHRNQCKSCIYELKVKNRRTVVGLLSYSYDKQISASKKRGHNNPMYTKNEFVNKFKFNDDFLRLFYYWKESNFKSDIKPSCDRLDDYKGYSFDNIRWVTWRENREKSYKDRKDGVNNKQGKPVFRVDIEGNIVGKYHSINQASRETGSSIANISSVCLGKTVSSKGYYWCFCEDYYKIKFNKKKPPQNKNTSGIVKLTLYDKFVEYFYKISDIEKNSNISSCCRGKFLKSNGFKWMYKDDYDEMLELKMSHSDFMKYKYPK